ncbi:SUKH-4 family immunity protein [Streptomyces virginiae]|uniref:SUKH-4 family immunity protein n=1 Tax=Streptomyces virginiae TaxID=1961 RepID=UPI00345444BD
MDANTGWHPYDTGTLARLGPGGGAAELGERGLPADCDRMFVRDAGRELSVRELPQGRAAFLGAFEDGVNTYWLLVGTGEVWIVHGYEDPGDGCADRRYGLVNTSVAGLQGVLEVWEGFLRSGRSEEDDGYEDFLADAVERARLCDPAVFEDEDSWWSRVFEEVELGVLGTWPAQGVAGTR